MFLPKSQIYETLKALGYYCQQSSQSVFADDETPAITFRLNDNSVNLNLDNQISSQEIEVNVDIWTDDSVTGSRILSEVEEAMRSIGYRMTYSADIPFPEGSLYHTNCRFNTVYAE